MQRFLIIAVLALTSATHAEAQTVDTRMLSRVRAADANGDKAVTRREFVTYRAGQFHALDRNHDGALTTADVPRFGGRAPMGIDIPAMVAQFDLNNDGRISEAEFANGPIVAFDTCDTDRDQVVTFAEIDAARARHR